jgi:hypothetical protein
VGGSRAGENAENPEKTGLKLASALGSAENALLGGHNGTSCRSHAIPSLAAASAALDA